MAGGGCAQEKLGSNGSAAQLLRGLGHTSTGAAPALTAMVCDRKPINGLAGIRVKATASVMLDGKTLHSEAGEILFTEYGLSGVCIMNCSCYWRQGADIVLDLLRAFGLRSRDELMRELEERREHRSGMACARLLTGLCVQRVADCVLKAAGISKDAGIGSLGDRELRRLCDAIAAFRVPVLGLRGFEQAQVTSGGIRAEEFDPGTMASKRVPGLYACGEVLDVTGECGGYNLMFAAATGLLAGVALAGTVKKSVG